MHNHGACAPATDKVVTDPVGSDRVEMALTSLGPTPVSAETSASQLPCKSVSETALPEDVCVQADSPTTVIR